MLLFTREQIHFGEVKGGCAHLRLDGIDAAAGQAGIEEWTGIALFFAEHPGRSNQLALQLMRPCAVHHEPLQAEPLVPGDPAAVIYGDGNALLLQAAPAASLANGQQVKRSICREIGLKFGGDQLIHLLPDQIQVFQPALRDEPCCRACMALIPLSISSLRCKSMQTSFCQSFLDPIYGYLLTYFDDRCKSPVAALPH